MADSQREDAEHVRRIAAEIPIEHVGLAYSAHPIGTFLSASGLLQRAVVELVEDRFDLVAFRQEAEAGRRLSPIYVSELARLQPAWRPRTGIALARRALEMVPDSPLAHHILARRLDEAGMPEEALRAHARAMALGDGFSGYALPYSQTLFQTGNVREALSIAIQLVEDEPELAALQSWLADLYWFNGQREKARRHARFARDLAPGNRHYVTNFALYHLPVGMSDRLRKMIGWLRRSRRHGYRR